METFSFEALGTAWEIDTPSPLPPDLQERLLQRIEAFEATYSRFRPDSVVSQVATARMGGRYAFPEDAVALFALYDELHRATGGAVDPLIGRDLELLGYDPNYSLVPASEQERSAAHAQGRPSWPQDVHREGRTIVTRRPLVIDVGAAGKGYAVDLISQVLRQAGLQAFTVDGSGDLRHAGPTALQVGLEHPLDPERVIGVVPVHQGALCASGVNRRTWGAGLHHVLDARTGRPVDHVIATWVMAEDAATADGLATALFFVGADRLTDTFSFSAVRMFHDGRVETTPNFAGQLFT